jgi:hypothetical protein
MQALESCSILLRLVHPAHFAGRAALTDNFDACRDLSGRRLRHVNADAKLAEWAAGARERELEKLGLKHIREAEKASAREAAQQARARTPSLKLLLACLPSGLHVCLAAPVRVRLQLMGGGVSCPQLTAAVEGQPDLSAAQQAGHDSCHACVTWWAQLQIRADAAGLHFKC